MPTTTTKKVFDGDGTPEHPPLYHRDVLAILPYQVSDRRFVLACYVMTRDVAVSLPPEAFEVRLSGLDGLRADVKGYDPLANRPIATAITERSKDTLTLQFSATDYPYLIQIEEK